MLARCGTESGCGRRGQPGFPLAAREEYGAAGRGEQARRLNVGASGHTWPLPCGARLNRNRYRAFPGVNKRPGGNRHDRLLHTSALFRLTPFAGARAEDGRAKRAYLLLTRPPLRPEPVAAVAGRHSLSSVRILPTCPRPRLLENLCSCDRDRGGGRHRREEREAKEERTLRWIFNSAASGRW